MTRETKAGLVVVASFLSLVAGVFIVKYTDVGQPAPAGDEKQSMAAADAMQSPALPAIPDVSGGKETAPVATPTGLAPIPLTPPPIKDNNDDPTNLVRARSSSTPVALTPPADITPTRFETPATLVALPDVPAPTLPVPGSEPKKADAPPGLVLPGDEPKKTEPAPTVVVPGSEPKKTDAIPMVVVPATDPKKAETPPAVVIPGSEPKKSEPPLIELPDGTPKKSGATPKIDLPTPDAVKPMTPPVLDLTVPGSTPKVPKSADPGLVPLPDNAAKVDAPKPIDLTNPDKKPVEPVPMPKPTEKAGDPGRIVVPDAVPPPAIPNSTRSPDPWKTVELPAAGKPAEPMNVVKPEPVGSPDTRSSAPPAVRLQLPMSGMPDFQDPPTRSQPPAEARVDSYDEEWYSCQAGDTLERISQRFFSHEKYAQALRLHNLDRDGRDLWRQERPTLQAGDVVKVPPVRILERNHPAVVPGVKPAPTGRPASLSNVPGGNVRDNTPISTLQPSNYSAPPGYEVPRDNMTFRDVARDTLGSSDKWMLIFRLNRGFNPEQTLPKGASLRLPSDARVPMP